MMTIQVHHKTGRITFKHLNVLGPGDDLMLLYSYGSQLIPVIKKNLSHYNVKQYEYVAIEFPMFSYLYDPEDETLGLNIPNWNYNNDDSCLVVDYKEAFKHMKKLKRKRLPTSVTCPHRHGKTPVWQ